MHDLLRLIRHAVETIVPWFDRAEADRHRAEIRTEIATSREVRKAAHRAILENIARRYERYDGAVRR